MATYLSIINKVLVRMREAQVSSIDQTEQSALIGQFVNDAKEEVEGAWKWNLLRTTVQISVLADATYAYALTGSGMKGRVLQARNETQGYEVRKSPSYQYMNSLFQTPNAVAAGDPQWWDFNGQDANGDRIVNFHPYTPSTTQVINFNMYVPDAELIEPGDELTLPSLQIVLRAHMLAVEERGDDGGTSLQVLNQRYDRALDDAIAADQDNYIAETIWTTV